MSAPFARAILDRLREVIEVRIETRSASDGPVHTAIIWVVVDDGGRVLVRSWRGATARWYREAISGTEAALILDGERIPVTIERATDPDRIAAPSWSGSTPATRPRGRWSARRSSTPPSRSMPADRPRVVARTPLAVPF